MPVKPPAPKHHTEDWGDKLVISMPSLRSPMMIFLTAYLALTWLVGEGFVTALPFLERSLQGRH